MLTTLLIIHILFASILFGGGILVSAYFIQGFLRADKSIKEQVIKTTFKANLFIIAPAGIIQLMSGFMLMILNLKNYDTSWLLITAISFSTAAFCWLIGLQLLNSCYHKTNTNLKRPFIGWISLAAIAFVGILVLIFVMATHAH